MKQLFLSLAFCFGLLTQAQIVNIPDANFKAKILSSSASNLVAKNLSDAYFAVDANGDGEIQNSEAQQVKYLDVRESAIASIEGINSFSNLEWFNCPDNQLTSITISGIASFKTLGCNYNQLTSINIIGATNFTGLECYNNQLTDGSLNMSQLTKLNYLWCQNNQLTTLDLSAMEHFNVLSAHHNQLTSIIFGNSKPYWLFVNDNQLTALNLPNGIALEDFDFSNNAISSMNWNSISPASLRKIYCSGNSLSGSLNLSAFYNLQYLSCNNNAITSLNITGCTLLKSIACNGNQLTTLNINGYPNLEFLGYGNNPMTAPNLSTLSTPTLLKSLECSNLGLTSLNLSTVTNLQTLDCTYNQLQTLNVNSQTNLSSLYCNNNLALQSIFCKNAKSESIVFSGCPNLQYICADDGQLSSIQFYISQYGYINCHVNSYCSFVPGGTFYTLQGTTRYDSNSNGCASSDPVIPNQRIAFSNGTATSNLISNTSGSYSYTVQAGTNTITPSMENNYFNVTPANYSVVFPTTTSPATRDFCLTSNGTHNDLEVVIVPLGTARPGFDAHYRIIYKNKGTHTQSGTVNLTFDDDLLDFVLATPVVNNQSTNNLSWSFSGLLPFQTRTIELWMNLNSPTETPAVNLGDILHYTVLVSGLTDETPIDNTSVFNQSVVNSFDPNDKTCIEGASVPTSVIGEYVHYIIRFENNGTANAQNIVVRDIIDIAKFDISTLRVMSSSHPMVTKITGTNKVEFIFQNINLPFNDANNDGYVTFKIKTKPALVDGDTFTNSASIYFDYNFPIVTNTFSSTIQSLAYADFEFSSYLVLSPNPAKDVLNLQLRDDVNISSVSIYNTIGQLILVVTQPSDAVDVSALETGTYFIKVISENGTSASKFIKE